ncbi:MAG: hypothetical protein O3A01_01160 [bacterium]|nr:hypothetical protein [bacterium]
MDEEFIFYKSKSFAQKTIRGPVASLIEELHALRHINIELVKRLRSIRKRNHEFRNIIAPLDVMRQMDREKIASKPDFFFDILFKQVPRLTDIQQFIFTDANLNPRPSHRPKEWESVNLDTIRESWEAYIKEHCTGESSLRSRLRVEEKVWLVKDSVTIMLNETSSALLEVAQKNGVAKQELILDFYVFSDYADKYDMEKTVSDMFPYDYMIVLSAPKLEISELKREELLSKFIIHASQEHFGECTMETDKTGTTLHFAIPKYAA